MIRRIQSLDATNHDPLSRCCRSRASMPSMPLRTSTLLGARAGSVPPRPQNTLGPGFFFARSEAWEKIDQT